MKHNGFTLMELMIAIVTISILASVAIPVYTDYNDGLVGSTSTNTTPPKFTSKQPIECQHLRNQNRKSKELTPKQHQTEIQSWIYK